MALPTCQCISGRPPFDRLADIFCALSQIDLACVIPTLLSATIDEDVLTLVFDEEVTGNTGFTIEVDGANDPLTYVSGEGTNTLVFSAQTAADPGVDVFLSYAPGDVASGPECPLAIIEGFVVTNNTGVQFTYVQPDGFAYLQPDGVSLYLQP